MEGADIDLAWVQRLNVLLELGERLLLALGLALGATVLLVVGVFVGVPTSRALINVGLALLLAGLVLGGGYRTLWARLRGYALLWPTAHQLAAH